MARYPRAVVIFMMLTATLLLTSGFQTDPTNTILPWGVWLILLLILVGLLILVFLRRDDDVSSPYQFAPDHEATPTAAPTGAVVHDEPAPDTDAPMVAPTGATVYDAAPLEDSQPTDDEIAPVSVSNAASPAVVRAFTESSDDETTADVPASARVYDTSADDATDAMDEADQVPIMTIAPSGEPMVMSAPVQQDTPPETTDERRVATFGQPEIGNRPALQADNPPSNTPAPLTSQQSEGAQRMDVRRIVGELRRREADSVSGEATPAPPESTTPQTTPDAQPRRTTLGDLAVDVVIPEALPAARGATRINFGDDETTADDGGMASTGGASQTDAAYNKLMTNVAQNERGSDPGYNLPPMGDNDFRIIEGIGPKIANILRKAGITTFDQLAQMPPDKIKVVLLEGGLTAINDPTTWPEQARLAAAGQWQELKALQDRLAAGRR